jgi:hypothetical protein
MLGDFTNIGYYEHGNLPQTLDGDFLLVQEDRIAAVELKLRGSYYTEPLRIRNYQDTSKLYLSAKVFKEFFPNRSPDFQGKGPAKVRLLFNEMAFRWPNLCHFIDCLRPSFWNGREWLERTKRDFRACIRRSIRCCGLCWDL